MIRYSDDLPKREALFGLFVTTGWNEKCRLTEDELYRAFQASWYHTFAFDDDRLIGSGRIICDGIAHALILDVIVHPEMQNQGIGKEIMRRIINRCREDNIRDIQLFSAKNKAGFYRKLGFRERPDAAPGMEWVNG